MFIFGLLFGRISYTNILLFYEIVFFCSMQCTSSQCWDTLVKSFHFNLYTERIRKLREKIGINVMKLQHIFNKCWDLLNVTVLIYLPVLFSFDPAKTECVFLGELSWWIYCGFGIKNDLILSLIDWWGVLIEVDPTAFWFSLLYWTFELWTESKEK